MRAPGHVCLVFLFFVKRFSHPPFFTPTPKLNRPSGRGMATSDVPSAVLATRALTTPSDDIAGWGNYLTAAADVSAGQLVYDSPQGQSLKVIDLAMSDKVCSHCGDLKSNEDGFLPQPCQCGECGAAAWCSHACREKDTGLHGMTCRFVRPLLLALRERHAGFVESPAEHEAVEWTEGVNLLSLLGSICLRAQHLGLDGASTQAAVRSSLYADILAMVSNIGLWPPGTRHQQLLGLWTACLTAALPAGWVPPDDELAQLVNAQTCNVIGLWLADYSSYGSVLEPWAALFNHSCMPNLARVQASRAGGHAYDHMHFVAMRDIKQGEPLNFSYLPSDVPFEERRQTTAAAYCFRCECERCGAAEAKTDTDGAAGRHTDGVPAASERRLPSTVACPCGGWMYPLDGARTCSICNQPVDDANDADDADAAAESAGGGPSGEGGSDQESDDGSDGDIERLLSCGGEHLASSECYCGGWRFKNRDQWLCVHCDYTIRVSPAQ